MDSPKPTISLYMDTFVNTLCDKFGYKVVIPDIIQNTLYFGVADAYQKHVSDDLQVRSRRLKVMIQEFFANSYIGILQNMEDLIMFYISFFKIMGRKYPWFDKDAMDDLNHDFKKLFPSYEVWDGKVAAEAFPRWLDHIKYLREEYAKKITEQGRKAKGVPDSCKKYFGSTFYENLLLKVKEVLSPGYVPETAKNSIIDDYYRLFQNRGFHVLSLLAAEPYPGRWAKYSDQRFKHAKALYRKVDDARREEINLTLIYSGVSVEQFTKCLVRQNTMGDSPKELVGRTFQAFSERIQALDIFLEDVTWDSLEIPANVDTWLGRVIGRDYLAQHAGVLGIAEQISPEVEAYVKAQRGKKIPIPGIARDAPPEPKSTKSVSMSPFLICAVIGIIIVLCFV